MFYKVKLLTLCLLIVPLAACAANEAQGNDANYEETKKMIVDILKTDDGKKALNEILADEQFKHQVIMDQETVKEAIRQALVSEQGQKFWEKQMADAKFAESMAKSMQKQHEELMKGLMNDPEYQKKLVEIMQDPEMEKNMLTLLKGNEFRSHLQELIGEAFDNPIFRAEIADMLKQVTSEELKAKGGDDSGQKAGDGDGDNTEGNGEGGDQSSS